MTSSTRDDSTNIETRAINDRSDPALALVARLGARLGTKVPTRPSVWSGDLFQAVKNDHK